MFSNYQEYNPNWSSSDDGTEEISLNITRSRPRYSTIPQYVPPVQIPMALKKRDIKEEQRKVTYNPYEKVDISEYMQNSVPNEWEDECKVTQIEDMINDYNHANTVWSDSSDNEDYIDNLI